MATKKAEASAWDGAKPFPSRFDDAVKAGGLGEGGAPVPAAVPREAIEQLTREAREHGRPFWVEPAPEEG
jgi:hypothetical protein